jgi:hypothetical protein
MRCEKLATERFLIEILVLCDMAFSIEYHQLDWPRFLQSLSIEASKNWCRITSAEGARVITGKEIEKARPT